MRSVQASSAECRLSSVHATACDRSGAPIGGKELNRVSLQDQPKTLLIVAS